QLRGEDHLGSSVLGFLLRGGIARNRRKFCAHCSGEVLRIYGFVLLEDVDNGSSPSGGKVPIIFQGPAPVVGHIVGMTFDEDGDIRILSQNASQLLYRFPALSPNSPASGAEQQLVLHRYVNFSITLLYRQSLPLKIGEGL